MWRRRPESIPEEVQDKCLRRGVLRVAEVCQAVYLWGLILLEGGVVEQEGPLMLLVLVVKVKLRLLIGMLFRVLQPTTPHAPVHGRHRVILDPPSGVLHETG
jgi:hypothetical protein